jgi:mannose-6-phosphate isomerase-like protein (cupin superfamily)
MRRIDLLRRVLLDDRGATTSLSPMAKVVPIEDLRRSPRAALFEGGDDAPLSIFVLQYARDEGPDLHLHPYPEVFVVQAGTAAFTAGDEQFVVEPGRIVVVPADTPHGFKGAGDDTLRVVSVHPSPSVQQTDL